jgi:hypothetical protein
MLNHIAEKSMCFSVVGINTDPKVGQFLRELMQETLAGNLVNIDIIIQPEIDNPFDPKAIAVHLNAVKVGYIARADQQHFNFNGKDCFGAKIVHWGVTQNNEAVFLYVQPYF